MARWSFYLLLLVLLVPVISLCESAEYYIRPTALTTNTSCPGQPCLTLNHYMNNTSHYIQSNTVLNFLPGKHVLKRPLHINNVQNVTLKSITAGSGMYSQLLVKFSCENESLNHCIYTQSAIQMINVTNVVINDISLEMWTPNVSGVIVEQSDDIHLVQLHIHSVQGNDSLAAGVAVNETSHLYMDRLQVGNLYNGIRIENTKKVSIINSSFDDCENSGIVIIKSDIIDISNTTLSNNMENGMHLESCSNTTLTSISATNNQQDGMDLISCSSVSLKDISIKNNSRFGMYLSLCINTDLRNINTTNNQDSGLVLSHCRHVRMMMMHLEKNQYYGVSFSLCENTTLVNVSALNNQNDGMFFHTCENTTITNISAINNQGHGMNFFYSCKNTTMVNISAINNQRDGVYFYSCKNTAMTNISAVNNQYNGIYFESCEDITMKNLSLINNQSYGMNFYSCENTTMMNIFAINNQDYGMNFYSCENTTMINISAINNQGYGMHFDSCETTTMMNISAINNQHDGMYFYSCKNTTMMTISAVNNHQSYGMHFDSCDTTTMMNISAINNQHDGMYFDSCKNTTMMNISAVNNGMYFESCENITMMNISAINNQGHGMNFHSCENATMMNISAKNNQWGGMYFVSCKNTTMMNISAINNQNNGIYIIGSDYTTIANTYTTSNQFSGVNVYACKNTTMTNVHAINNQHEGIYKVKCTSTILTDINATYNQNGGIKIESHFQNIVLRNISVNHNGNVQITFSSSDNIQLEYSTFSDIIALSTLNIATNPRSVPAVIELNDCTLIVSNCTFRRNNITSIRSIASKIIAEGEIIFSDNRALSGAALLFVSSSVLVITDTSIVYFQKNHALNYGGAIYILTDEYYNKSMSIQDILIFGTNYFHEYFNPSMATPRTRCFLSVKANRSQARLIFTNNTADKGGDVVYGGLVALGYDGDWNCLLSFKNISDMSQQNGLSTISSEPSRVCLCHDGQPDCLTVADPITRNIYPGQTITLPAVVVGQDFGTVMGFVIPQFLQDYTTCSIQFEQGQKSTFVDNGQCANLRYTLYTSGGENCTAIMTLKSNNAEVFQPMNTDDNHKLKKSWTTLNKEPNYYELGSYLKSMSDTSNYSEAFVHNFLKLDWDEKFVFPNEIYNYPTFINISFHSCPLGFALSRNPPFKCDCNHLLQQMPRVTCDIQHQTISRDGLVWVGTYGDNTVAASKYCPYNYCKRVHTRISVTESEYINSEVNLTAQEYYINHSTTDVQCNLHHSGVLCGGCQPGLSLALGTNQCLHCSNVYISLLLPFAMAGLLLVFLIKLLNLTISQGTMNELIFYVNVVSANKHLYYSQTSVNPMTLFIAWLNLDIGIETCFFNGLTAYSRTWLQFVFPLYIWAIAGLIIIIAKYSDRVAKVMGNNGVAVLATLFLLSYAKLFNTIITAMSYTTLYTTQGQKLVWSADGNLDYLGPKHIPLFCVAVAALVFLWFPYTLLLLLGQWLHRLNCRVITHLLLKLKPFLDAHFAAFKDKHRYWFGLLLFVRVANLLISESIPDNNNAIVEFSTAILCILLTSWVQKAYCSSAVGTFGTAFLLNLSIMKLTKLFSMIISDGNIAVAHASFTFIAIALAQFLGLILYKVVVIFKCSRRITAWCSHENKPNDDWELYEQAALEREQAALVREMESESEEDRESNESGSIESVPTYGM